MGAKAKFHHNAWFVFFHHEGDRWAERQPDEKTARQVEGAFNRKHPGRSKPKAAGTGGSKAFDAIAQRWWESSSGGWAETTRHARDDAMKRLVVLLGPRDVRTLDKKSIDELAQKLSPPHTTYAFSTVTGTMDLLATILNWAVENKIIREIPSTHMRATGRRVAKAKCRTTKTRDAWSHEEANAILATCREHGAWLYDAALFALRTGCRQGELVALQWPSVDLNRGCVTIQESRSMTETKAPKNGEIRTRPLPQDVLDHMRGMYERRLNDGYVFLNSMHEPMKAKSLSGFWAKLVRRCKRARPLSWHCFRHTCATWLLDQGWSPESAAQYIGHDPVTFRKHYAHVIQDKHLDLNFFQRTPDAMPEQGKRGPRRKAARKGLRLVR